MYLLLERIKLRLGPSYDYVLARALSFPILLGVLFLLGKLPSGRSSLLIYSVMLVGSLINGSVGQSLYQHQTLKLRSIPLFNLGIAIVEFLLIFFVSWCNGVYLFSDLAISFFVFFYVFFRVSTMILMNHLYGHPHYIQSINFIFSKLIDLLLVYFISNLEGAELNKVLGSIDLVMVISLFFLTITVIIFLYQKFKPLLLNSLIRLPVALLYMVFSFIFFNNIADVLRTNSAYLFRLKGFFDALASIVSVASLKTNLVKRPNLTNFNSIIYFCIIASLIIHFNIFLGMILFSAIAVFSATVYSRTVIVHGVHVNSLAWSLSLLTAILIILINSKYTSLAFSISETMPLMVIYYMDARHKKND